MRVFQVINSVFTSNSYILREENELKIYLIDIGDVDPVLDYLTDISMAKVEGVFLHISIMTIFMVFVVYWNSIRSVWFIPLLLGKKH